MPYSVNDVVRIEDVQLMLGQTLRNVYFYELTSVTGTVLGTEILTTFAVDVINVVQRIQSTSLEHTGAKIDNVTDGLSFAEIPLVGDVGDRAGAVMPTYVAYGFKLLRGSKATRNGFKRISGVTEDIVVGNFIDVPFRTGTDMTAVIAILQDEILVTGLDGSLTMRPVIASRPTASRPSYLTQPVVGVELQPAITTQVSRKAGRGE